MSHPYRLGRLFEYTAANLLRKWGYTVLRTAGSHGFADLVVVSDTGDVHFLQLKTIREAYVGERRLATLWRKATDGLAPGIRSRYILIVRVLAGVGTKSSRVAAVLEDGGRLAIVWGKGTDVLGNLFPGGSP